MRPNTALGLLLLGISVWLDREHETNAVKRRAVQILGGVAALIGVFTLTGYVTGLPFFAAQLIFSNAASTIAPGQMAVMTAVDFLPLGCSLQLSAHRRAHMAAQYLVITAGCLGLLNVVSYLYGSMSFYRLTFHAGQEFSTAMALHTSVTFVFFSRAYFNSRPNWGLIATVIL